MKKNKGFTEVVLIIVVILSSIAFGAYQVFFKDKVVEDSVSVSTGDNFPEDYKPADHTNNSVSNTNTSDWKTYRNSKYGYELTLTESWKDNQIVENSDGSVDFKTKVANGEYWRLYHIVPVGIEEWDKDAKECSKKSVDEQNSIECLFVSWSLGRNDKYVFMAMSAQDFPPESQLAHDDFRNEILPTFKLFK